MILIAALRRTAARAASLALAAALLAPSVIHANALPLYIADPTSNEKPASGDFFSLGESNVKRSLSLAAKKRWGNDYMHARYYSPNLGRFMSVDPVGGTVGSSQSWNRYSYVLNNPLNLVDPTGMMNDVPNTMTGEAFGKKPLMQPATTPEGQRLDALFVSVYLSIGGSVLTGPIGGRVTTILLSGGWNLAGGATYRALDGDATTNASDLAAGIGDVGLGMLGGAGGVAISKASPATRALGTGGARAAAFLTSNGLPPLIDTAIDQTVSAMESSGILEKMLDMTSSIPNPNALDPSVNCHLTQQNTLVVSAGPPKMVEYLMYSSH